MIILSEKVNRIFSFSSLDLRNVTQERKSTFDKFQKAV